MAKGLSRMTKRSIDAVGERMKEPSHRSVHLHDDFESNQGLEFTQGDCFIYTESDFNFSHRDRNIYVPSEEFKITQSEILNLFDLLVKVLVGAVIAIPVLLVIVAIIFALMVIGLRVFGVGFLPFGILGVLAGGIFGLRMVLIAFMKWMKIPA